ncbi:MAG TPA: T9SS type A sorting domain-containing protein [Bacteroidia bacterium]|nr:T9SS type A sorting domain-containing protein [Bacteroidia bacterium]
MKRKSPIFKSCMAALGFALLSLNSFAQHTSAFNFADDENMSMKNKIHPATKQLNTLVQLTDSIYEWHLDTATMTWNPYQRTINMLYDTNNNLANELRQSWNDSAWVNYSRGIYTYNGNNYITSFIGQWGAALLNNYKAIYSYDANNNLINQLGQTWNGSAWVNGWQYLYSYDANNNMLNELTQSWNGSTWVNSWQLLDTYDANSNHTSHEYQQWNGSAWVPYYYKDSWNYDANNNMMYHLMQGWNGSAWRNYSQVFFTYDSNNNQTSWLRQGFSGITNTWVDDERDTLIYDANNNLINEIHEWFWNGNNTWQCTYYTSNAYDINNNRLSALSQNCWSNIFSNYSLLTYTYDANNNKTNDLFQKWGDSVWINMEQKTWTFDANNFMISYVDIIWDTTGLIVGHTTGLIATGDSIHYYFHFPDTTPPPLPVYEGITIFPNPSSGIFTIQTEEQFINSTMTIFNVLGEEILEQKILAALTEINLSHHARGIYFLQLRTSGQTISKKIILQK